MNEPSRTSPRVTREARRAPAPVDVRHASAPEPIAGLVQGRVEHPSGSRLDFVRGTGAQVGDDDVEGRTGAPLARR